MGQGKIVLQKDIPKAGSNFLVSVVRFRPGPPLNYLKHPSLATGVFCFKRKRKNNIRLNHFPLMLSFYTAIKCIRVSRQVKLTPSHSTSHRHTKRH